MATGIIEKGSAGLFYNEIEFNNQYANYARFLKEDLGLFSTFREVYVTGAVIGCMNKIRQNPDNTDKFPSASVFPNELSKRRLDLEFLYRAFMLTYERPNYTIDDYINRAFRDDAEDGNKEQFKENMNIFNEMACSGVELLYNKFKDCKDEDTLVNTLYNYLREFGKNVSLLEDDDLPDITPTFK